MDIKSSLLALNLESGIDEIGLLADLSASKRRKVHDTGVVFFFAVDKLKAVAAR